MAVIRPLPWRIDSQPDNTRGVTVKRCTRYRGAAVVAGFLALAPVAVDAQPAVESFYRGKTISLIVGSAPGGGYDAYARAVAGHIGRHLPGEPSVIVKNMPGAGSRKAGNYLFHAAPKDGSIFGGIFPGAIMEPLIGDRRKVKFNPTGFQYIGSANQGVSTCVAWRGSGVRSFKGAMRRELILGASSRGGSTRDFPLFLNNMVGTRFKVVTGYRGTRDITLAVEQGEVQGLCGYNWSSLSTQKADWLKNRKVRILVQVALKGHPALNRRGVPMIWDFIKSPQKRDAAELFVSQLVFARPYVAPPGVPEDRVAALRTAFSKTMADPQFLADAKKLKLDINPVSGDEVQKLIEKLFKAPPGVVQRAKRALQPPRR